MPHSASPKPRRRHSTEETAWCGRVRGQVVGIDAFQLAGLALYGRNPDRGSNGYAGPRLFVYNSTRRFESTFRCWQPVRPDGDYASSEVVSLAGLSRSSSSPDSGCVNGPRVPNQYECRRYDLCSALGYDAS